MINKLIRRAAAAAVPVFVSNAALTQETTNWKGAQSKDWFTERNWDNGVPDDQSDVSIDDQYPGEVSSNAVIIERSFINGTAEAATLTIGASSSSNLTLTNLGNLDVETVAFGSGQITLNSGNASGNSLASTLQVDNLGFTGGNGDSGYLVIQEGGEVVVSEGISFTAAGGGTQESYIAFGNSLGAEAKGAGKLTLSGIDAINFTAIGGTNGLVFNHTNNNLEFSSQLIGGSGAASVYTENGTTILTGDGSQFSGNFNIDGGTLQIANTFAGGDLVVGDTSDNSDLLLIQDGNSLSLSGAAVIGNESTGVGTVTVTGSDDQTSSTLTVDGTTTIGAAGNGSLILSEEGIFESDGGDGMITIAQSTGSAGLIVFGAGSGDDAAAAGSLLAGSVSFGEGTGTLLFNHTSTADNPLVFAPAISGAGTVSLIAGSTQLASANSLFTGSLNADGGDLIVAADNTAGEMIVGDASTGGTVSVNGGTTLAISGETIIGNQLGSVGVLNVVGTDAQEPAVLTTNALTIGSSGTGTLNLSNAEISVEKGSGTVEIASAVGSAGTLVIGAATGEIAISPGTVSTKEIAFGDGSEGFIILNHTDTSGSYELAAELSGNGNLLAENGVTVLTKDSESFSGVTSIAGGTLIVNSSLAGSVVVSSGILSGSGDLKGTTQIQSGGTIAPGNVSDDSFGELAVSDISIESGATFSVGIDGKSEFSSIKSSGTVTLEGGTVAVVADSYSDSQDFTIVSADQAVDGTFTDITGNTATISYFLSYGDTDVVLTQLVSQSFASIGESENHIAVGRTLDSLEIDDPVVQHTHGAMTETEAQAIYDRLSGQVHASLQGALMENDRKVSAAINRRLEADTANNSSVFAYGSGPSSGSSHGAWVTGIGGWTDIDATGNTASANNDYGGVVAGLDREFGDNWRLGLVGAYGHTDLTQSSLTSSSSADSFSAGFYAGTMQGPFHVNLGGLFGWHDIDTSRTIEIGDATQNLMASYHATGWQLFGEADYRFDRGDTQFRPFAGLSYMQLDTDGFTESGGSAALTAASSTQSTTFTTLGMRIGHQVTESVRARGMAGWRHAFGDIDPTSSFLLAGSSPFTITGAPIAEDALVIEAGLEVKASNNLTIDISYDGQFGDGSTANQIGGSLGLRF